MNTPQRFQFKRPVQMQAIDVAGRVPPHNEDAEASVLSAVLLEGSVLDEVTAILPNGEPFFSDAHKRIYDACIELHGRRQPVDVQTVADLLKDRERLDAVGGVSYLVKIVDATPAVAHVAAHAMIVREKWRVRQTIAASQMVAAEGFGDYGQADEWINKSVERLANIADARLERRDASLLYDVVRGQILAYGTTAMQGTMSGFTDVDTKTSGMHDGELIIVAARPGMGKTALVMNMAVNIASRTPDEGSFGTAEGVMVFSLEMPKEQLASRMMCSEGRVSMTSWRKQELSHAEYDRVVEAADRLGQMPVWIDDTPAITLTELRAKVRRKQHEFDKKHPPREGVTDPGWKQRLALVVVDYLQLMRGSPNAQSREQEISELSRGLKALAKELHVPVVALSQLNRSVETRSTKDKRPQLSDLRESGAIEQDADMVQFIFRPEYYIADKQSAEARQKKGYAEIIIAKQRNGPTGRVPVTFIDDYVRFENRSKDSWRDSEED